MHTFTAPLSPLPLCFFKKAGLQKTADRTKQGITRQDKSNHIEAGQGNLIEVKETQKQPKITRCKIYPLPLLGVSQEQETNHHHIGPEDLFQTHVGTEFSTSVSVSKCEPCLVDSVDHVLLVSSIFSDCYNLPSLPLWYSPICLWGEDLTKTSNLEFHHIWTGSAILYLLQSGARGSLCDHGWTRDWSMNIAEYDQESFYWYWFFCHF